MRRSGRRNTRGGEARVGAATQWTTVPRLGGRSALRDRIGHSPYRPVDGDQGPSGVPVGSISGVRFRCGRLRAGCAWAISHGDQPRTPFWVLDVSAGIGRFLGEFLGRYLPDRRFLPWLQEERRESRVARFSTCTSVSCPTSQSSSSSVALDSQPAVFPPSPASKIVRVLWTHSVSRRLFFGKRIKERYRPTLCNGNYSSVSEIGKMRYSNAGSAKRNAAEGAQNNSKWYQFHMDFLKVTAEHQR